METTNDTGKRLESDKPDILIGTAKKMGIGLDLTQVTVVILCEPVYDPNLYKQIPKRAHRLRQKEETHYHVLHTDTEIKWRVNDKRLSCSGFGADAFRTADLTSR